MRMNTAYIPILLIVAGGLIYQLSQKAIRHEVNVYFAICAAYLAGIVLCLITQYFYPADEPFWQSAKKMNWAIIGVGLGAALVEVGFLIAYRAGWKISATSMLVNMLMSVALVPIGVFFFRDKISKWNALGIAFYFAGLILISRK
jgi:drug/metabolite transporter (DMT)-like permease